MKDSKKPADRIVMGDVVYQGSEPDESLEAAKAFVSDAGYNAVTPPHYRRGPEISVPLGDSGTRGLHSVKHVVQCIDVMRRVRDPRLATALKYIWRVAFGGKREPWETRTQHEIDVRDISSAVWYLQDWISNPPEDVDTAGSGA